MVGLTRPLNILNFLMYNQLQSQELNKNIKLPAMFPSAQTACSQTLLCDEDSSLMKGPTAPSFTTARVCSDDPDATFVMAHAASNWRSGLLDYKLGISFVNIYKFK